jgi:hypothetical protein
MCRSGRYRILGEGGWVRASSHIFLCLFRVGGRGRAHCVRSDFGRARETILGARDTHAGGYFGCALLRTRTAMHEETPTL